ncbi:MAG: hypothetical protein LBB89_09170 [Treponema sp.]|jgi:hypothetical protein|nr:hypothetical protein [Treponema sp.]
MKFIAILFAVCFICSCSSTPPEEPFSVNLDSPRFEAGSIEAHFNKSFSITGGLKKDAVTVYYYPAEDAVCLQFNIMYVHCNQFWDRDGRDAFVSAFERYKEEYEQRKLAKGNRKTREMYGTAQGFFTWKKTPISVQAYGHPKIKLGYQFNNQSVFFTVTQMESYYEDPQTHSRNQTSPVTEIYFTRAQAESLIALFKKEHLQGLGLPPRTGGGGEGMDGY